MQLGIIQHTGDTVRMVSGKVKWFDQAKGFGFVVADDGGADILLHANVLRNFGQSSIADSTPLVISVQDTARGMQATEVVSIGELEPAVASEFDEFPGLSVDLSQLELVAARIKWFDKAKGFGFANAFGSSADIFVHVETLRRYGLADLMPGEAVCLKVADGERGKMAVEVRSWDMALQKP